MTASPSRIPRRVESKAMEESIQLVVGTFICYKYPFVEELTTRVAVAQ